jgi:hypothetical protein
MIKGNDLNLDFLAMDKYHAAGMLCSSPYVEISDNTCSSGLINSANNYVPNSLMMMSNSNAQYYPSWFTMKEIKPNHGCSLQNRSSNLIYTDSKSKRVAGCKCGCDDIAIACK